MQGGRNVPAAAYVIVFLVLGGYFAWLIDRMAVFSRHGVSRAEWIGIGLGVAVLGLVVAGAIGATGRARERRDRER